MMYIIYILYSCNMDTEYIEKYHIQVIPGGSTHTLNKNVKRDRLKSAVLLIIIIIYLTNLY